MRAGFVADTVACGVWQACLAVLQNIQAIRKNRPKEELVRDSVEHEFRKQINNLNGSVSCGCLCTFTFVCGADQTCMCTAGVPPSHHQARRGSEAAPGNPRWP